MERPEHNLRNQTGTTAAQLAPRRFGVERPMSKNIFLPALLLGLCSWAASAGAFPGVFAGKGSARRIKNMMTTLFLSADGKPMSAAQFLESLFGVLPDFFKDEDELRSIWSGPDTKRSVFVYRVGHQLLSAENLSGRAITAELPRRAALARTASISSI